MQRSNSLRYIEGLRYRTTEAYWVMSNLRPESEIHLNRITLTREGLFFVEAGYSSDGPSGPTIDTKDFMPGATGWHDPIYELLRNEMLHVNIDIIQPDSRPGSPSIYTNKESSIIRHATHEQIRQEADMFLIDIMVLDWEKLKFKPIPEFLHTLRLKYIYDALRVGGVSSASLCTKVYSAP